MTDEGERIVAEKVRNDSQDRRIDKLENNQRWGVLTILALGAKALFDIVTKGSGQ